MWLMLQQSRAEDYVLATGQLHSVRDFVELAFSSVDLDWRKYVKVDPGLVRPAETRPLVGDASKAHRQLGWKPEISFEEMVRMLVYEDIRRLG
jgi:GDPmannose 4,6-dehydratase